MNRGFTLLELMLSITMIGIIILITAGAMRLGYRSVEKGDERMESVERIKSSINLMISQIQSSFPLTYEDNGEKKYRFRGERQSIEFSTNYSVWRGQKGYVTVKYMVEEEGGKSNLYASEGIVGTENVRNIKLLDASDEIHFEYFERDVTNEKGTWVSAWTDDSKLPQKVKIHVLIKGKDLSIVIPFRARPLDENIDEQS